MTGPLFELMAKLGLDASGYVQGLKDSEGQANSFIAKVGGGLKAFGAVGVAALGAATTAVGAFAGTSVRVGMDFDSAMSQVQATMLKTADEMEKDVGAVDTAYGHFKGNLRQFAQFLGENTKFSATEAAEALNYMALAGYNTQQSLEMLPNVLSLAAAGGFDLATASDMVTDAQTAFGLSAERTTQMVDEMAKAASTGNTSVQQLGDAFLVVGGLAQELNGGVVDLSNGTKASVDGIQEMEIALTAMANAGIKGSEAGTHMRNVIMKLSDPTDAGTMALQNMGVAIFDAQGKMRSLSDIFGDLNQSMSTMTQQEKIQTIASLFNARDLSSAEALLSAVSQDWDAIGESILNAKGAAAEMADIQLDNLEGDLTLFKSALEGFQIVVSDKLKEPLREFVQLGTKGLSDITSAFKEGGLDAAMASFGDTISEGLTLILGKVPEAVSAGAALLGALGQGLVDNAPLIINSAKEVVQMLWEYVVDAAPKLVDAGVKMLGQLADGMQEGIPELLGKVMPMLTELSGGLRENAGKLIEAGLDLLVNMAKGFADGLPVLIENIPTIVTNIAGIINDNAPKILMAGVQIVIALVQGIIQAIPTLIANIPKIAEAIFAVWSAINWVNLGLNLIIWIKNGITSLATAIPNTIKDIALKAFNFFKNVDWAGLGATSISTILRGIVSLWTAIPDAIFNIATDAIIAISNIDWLSIGINIIRGIANGIKNMAGTLINSLIDAVKGAYNRAKDFLGIHSPSTLFRDNVGKMMALGIGEGFEENIPNLDMASTLRDNIQVVSTSAPSVIPTGLAQGESRDTTVILQLDRDQFARAVFQLYNSEKQRVGLNLAGVNI